MKNEWISIRLTEALKKRLAQDAQANHRTLASHVVAIIEKYLESKK